MREYGSEHHWQSRAGYVTGSGGLELEGCSLFRSGRDAMKQMARALPGMKILLPALCCESMILPFTLNGCPVEFYRLNDDLTGSEGDVLSKAGAGTVLLYMTYFDILPFTPAFLEKLRQRGVFLLEDRTQDILMPRRGGFRPDATVASLRKWAAMPEGGLLKTSMKLPEAGTDSRFGALRREAMDEKGEYLKSGRPELKESFLEKLHQADRLLDESGEPVAMSRENRMYLEELDFEKILSARRSNAAVLERELAAQKEAGRLRPLSDSRNTAGLYYGLLLENRDEVQRYMAERGIYCPVIWPIPEMAAGVCESCEYISGHILALPCDQRYGGRDMEHIAGVLRAALA